MNLYFCICVRVCECVFLYFCAIAFLLWSSRLPFWRSSTKATSFPRVFVAVHWAVSISILLQHIYHLCTEQYLYQYFCNTYIIFTLCNIYINIICALETQFIVIWFTNNNNFATDPIIIHSIEVHWCIIVWMYIFTTWYVPKSSSSVCWITSLLSFRAPT